MTDTINKILWDLLALRERALDIAKKSDNTKAWRVCADITKAVNTAASMACQVSKTADQVAPIAGR